MIKAYLPNRPRAMYSPEEQLKPERSDKPRARWTFPGHKSSDESGVKIGDDIHRRGSSPSALCKYRRRRNISASHTQLEITSVAEEVVLYSVSRCLSCQSNPQL